MDLKLKSRSSTSVAKECALPAIFQYWTREHHKRPLNSFQLEKSSTGSLKVQLLGILLIFERPLSPSRSGQEFLKPRTHLTEDWLNLTDWSLRWDEFYDEENFYPGSLYFFDGRKVSLAKLSKQNMKTDASTISQGHVVGNSISQKHGAWGQMLKKF